MASDLHIKYYRRFKQIIKGTEEPVQSTLNETLQSQKVEEKLNPTPPKFSDPREILRLRKTRNIFQSKDRVKYDYEKKKYKIVSSPTMAGLASMRRERHNSGSPFSEDQEILDRSFDTLLKCPRRPQLDALKQDLDLQRFSAKKLIECAQELASDQDVRKSMNEMEIVSACHRSNRKAKHPFSSELSPQAHQSPKFSAQVPKTYSPLLTTLPEEHSQNFTPYTHFDDNSLDNVQQSLSFREPNRSRLSIRPQFQQIASEPITTKNVSFPYRTTRPRSALPRPRAKAGTSFGNTQSSYSDRNSAYYSSLTTGKKQNRKGLSKRETQKLVDRLYRVRSTSQRCNSCTKSGTQMSIVSRKEACRSRPVQTKMIKISSGQSTLSQKTMASALRTSRFLEEKKKNERQKFGKRNSEKKQTANRTDKCRSSGRKKAKDFSENIVEQLVQKNEEDIRRVTQEYEEKIRELTANTEATRESYQAEINGVQNLIATMQRALEQRATEAAIKVHETHFQKLYEEEHLKREQIEGEIRGMKLQMEALLVENKKMQKLLRRQRLEVKENTKPRRASLSMQSAARRSSVGKKEKANESFNFSQKLKDIEEKASRDLRNNTSLSLTLSQIEQDSMEMNARAERVGKIFFS